jgi:hypothetical protein
MKPDRCGRGRFMTRSPVNMLMAAIEEIALSATDGCSAKAERLTKRAWDRERERLGRHDLPRAESIRQRLGVEWTVALDIALGAPGQRLRRLGLAGKERFPESSLPDEQILNVLRGLERRLGGRPTVSAYEAHRAEFNKRRSPRALPKTHLPCLETIAKRFGSFADALDAAGVAADRARPRAVVRQPVCALQTLDAFISDQGFLPTRDYFLRWAAAQDLTVGRDGREWAPLVEAVRALRSQRGDTTPSRPVPASQAPRLPAAPSRRTVYVLEDIVASVALWGREHLAPGTAPKWRDYLEAARTDDRLLAASTVNRYGRWADLCALAGL